MQTLLQAKFQPKIQNVGLMMKIFRLNSCTSKIHCELEIPAGLDVVGQGGGGELVIQ